MITLTAPLLPYATFQGISAAESCDHEAFLAIQISRRENIMQKLNAHLAEFREIGKQRRAISSRRIELAEGRHRLRGAFDPNYSSEALAAKDRELAQRQELIRQETQFLQLEIQSLNLESESFEIQCGPLQSGSS